MTEYHPLFELRDGETPEDFPAKEVHLIRVFRLSVNGDRGELLHKCSGDRLVDESQIVEAFGGGWYELEARHAGAIYRKERIRLPGPPKDGTFAMPAGPPAAIATAAPNGTNPSANDGMFALMLQMMDRNAAQREQASREQMQMLLAMMQNNQSVLVAAMSGAQQNASGINGLMSNVLTRAMDRPAPSSGVDVESIGKLIRLAKDLAPASDEGSLTSMVSNFVGGLVGAQQMAVQQQQQQQQPPAAPPIIDVAGTNGAPAQPQG